MTRTLSDPLTLPCGAVLRNRPVKAAMSDPLDEGSGGMTAVHGFRLSQILSPLFKRRSDGYGGDIDTRCRLLLDALFPDRNGR